MAIYQAGAFYDAANGDTVQIDHIESDSELVPTMIGKMKGHGSKSFRARKYELNLRFSDELASKLNTLDQWMTEQRDTIRFVAAASYGKSILWQESNEIEVIPGVDFDPEGEVVHEVQKTVVAQSPSVDQVVNLLNGFGTSDPQTLVMPLAGITWTLSWDASTTGTITIEALDFGNTQLESKSTSLAQGSRQSMKITTPANTYKLKITGMSQTSNEALRIGTTEYVDY